MELRLPEWPIIDFHVHFPVPGSFLGGSRQRFIARFGQRKWDLLAKARSEYQEDWFLSWAFPRPEEASRTWEEQADRWRAEADQYNLARVVFVTGGGNDQLAKIVARHPDRFLGFAHHDPFAPDAARELERAVTQLGLRGYKVFAPLLDRRLDDEAAFPVWEVAERHRLPVLIHFGILGGGGGTGNALNIDPLVLHDVAKAFPEVPFVIPHFATGYVRELLQLAWACRNVHVDSSGNNEWVRWMPYDLDIQTLFRRFYETVGPERIIFGSDSSWFPRGFAVRYLLDQFRACRQLRLPDEHLRLIFGGNAARLLHLDS